MYWVAGGWQVLTVELPYPPSVNHYYFYGRGRVFIGTKGKAYRKLVAAALEEAGAKSYRGLVHLNVALYPPDKRRRDIDNPMKALLDAVQHGGALEDDCQVKKLSVEFKPPRKGGATLIRPHL
jgi:Holliday junction resolvase RusA-like endonuclease